MTFHELSTWFFSSRFLNAEFFDALRWLLYCSWELEPHGQCVEVLVAADRQYAFANLPALTLFGQVQIHPTCHFCLMIPCLYQTHSFWQEWETAISSVCLSDWMVDQHRRFPGSRHFFVSFLDFKLMWSYLHSRERVVSCPPINACSWKRENSIAFSLVFIHPWMRLMHILCLQYSPVIHFCTWHSFLRRQ